MHRERLTILRDHLLTIQEKPIRRFNMYVWFSEAGGCGTAACALGEACFIPEFQKAGLTFYSHEDLHPYPTYKDRQGYDAGAAFFEISEEESSFIFDPERYFGYLIIPKDVADRISDLIAEDTIPLKR